MKQLVLNDMEPNNYKIVYHLHIRGEHKHHCDTVNSQQADLCNTGPQNIKTSAINLHRWAWSSLGPTTCIRARSSDGSFCLLITCTCTSSGSVTLLNNGLLLSVMRVSWSPAIFCWLLLWLGSWWTVWLNLHAQQFTVNSKPRNTAVNKYCTF